MNKEKKVIRKITIISGTGVKSYEVGETFGSPLKTVAEIKDNSIEYEDSIYFLYSVFDKDNNLLARIENCPTVIEYK